MISLNDILDIVKKQGVTKYNNGEMYIIYKGVHIDSANGEWEEYNIVRRIDGG